MAGFFTDLLGGLSGGTAGLISGGLNLVGSLIGGNRAQQGYDDAAAGIRADNAAAREELKAAKERGIGHIDQGTANYAGTVGPLMAERPILLPSYRGLTRQQQMGRQDLIRTGQAALASSGLRGAGRAGVGTLLNSVARYDAGARDATDGANRVAKQAARSSADAARTGLATVQANAGTAKANTEIGVGSQNAANLTNQGQTLGNIAVQSGNTAADMATNIGNLAGRTVMWGAGYGAGSPNDPPLAPQYGQRQPQPQARV
jgi:hypothetical protein